MFFDISGIADWLEGSIPYKYQILQPRCNQDHFKGYFDVIVDVVKGDTKGDTLQNSGITFTK